MIVKNLRGSPPNQRKKDERERMEERIGIDEEKEEVEKKVSTE